MDLDELAARARQELQRAGRGAVSVEALARDAGISATSLRTSLSPARQRRSKTLPEHLRKIAGAAEARGEMLKAIAANLRKLVEEYER